MEWKFDKLREERTLTEADVEDLGWKHDAASDGEIHHANGINWLGQHLVDVAQDHRAQAPQGPVAVPRRRRGVQEGPEPAATLALRRGGLRLAPRQKRPAGHQPRQRRHAIRRRRRSRVTNAARQPGEARHHGEARRRCLGARRLKHRSRRHWSRRCRPRARCAREAVCWRRRSRSGEAREDGAACPGPRPARESEGVGVRCA
jgi:hypothetical protein